MIPLFLDLDDVVLDTTVTIRQLKDYIIFHQKDLGISKENIDDAVFSFLFSNYSKVPIKEGFLQVYDLIKDDFEVVFVSMYVSEEEHAFKSYLARRLGVDIILLNVLEYKDKSSVDMSRGIFIDDDLLMLGSSNAKNKILFTSKIAKVLGSIRFSRDYSLVSSWEEVYRKLEGYSSGKEKEIR